MLNPLLSKFKESLLSILPITLLVVFLGITIIPLPVESLLNFVFACLLLVVGMSLFTLGADNAMLPIGQHTGSYLSKKGKHWLTFLCCLVLGVIITIAEPDLSVLASQFSAVNPWVFIVVVAAGVGLFLVLGLLRILMKWKYNVVITICYILIFLLVIFADQIIVPISFDAGGVTTGPISVPLIMALGVGFATVRGSQSKDDSFGMLGLCSSGPILTIMLLMWILGVHNVTPVDTESMGFVPAILMYMKDVAIIIIPIAVFFALFQIFALKLPKKEIFKIISGIIYTYIGIVIFLVGVSVGFLPVAKELGNYISANTPQLLIPISAVLGFSLAIIEPAVQVLCKQIGEVTEGLVKKRTMLLCIAIGVALALALSAIRVLTHISILWILVPAYALALILSFIAPKLFVGIAFDSGGVATGSMATTFALPLMIGATTQVGGSVLYDAFGTLAFCSIAPILVVLIFGVIYRIGSAKLKSKTEEMEKVKRVDIVEYD